jgi:hypothetical protein
MSNFLKLTCYEVVIQPYKSKKKPVIMEKTIRLTNLLLIFIPLVLLAFIAGFIGLVFFEIRRWKLFFCQPIK